MSASLSLATALWSTIALAQATAETLTPTKLTPEKLTLERAMSLAQERGYAARIAEQTRASAEAKVGQARGALGPRIDADAQKVWFSDDVNKLAGVSPQVPKEVTTAGVTASQPILGLAAILLQVRAAALQADVARNDEGTAQKDARVAGAQAYINAQKASQLVAVAESSLQVTQNQSREADSLARAGRLNRAEAMRFELALADARTQLSQARITQEIAMTALSETLGAPGQRYTLDTPEGSHFERAKPTLPALDAALGAAAQKRPESRNAAATVQIAEYYKLAGRLDYAPSLGAFARYERNFEAQDVTLPQPGAPGARTFAEEDVRDTFSYGLRLQWNIWDWGSRWNRSSEYEANLQRARIAKEATESGVRLDVTSATLQLRGAVEALETSKTSVRLAEEVYRLTQVRFQQGQATTTDVIAAERDQTRARGGLVNARGEVDVAWLRYQKAIGESPAAK
jgi:OMF family outer membrane factor